MEEEQEAVTSEAYLITEAKQKPNIRDSSS